jgi:mevalonate kinase
MSEHTPTPWKVFGGLITDSDHRAVAALYNKDDQGEAVRSHATNEANAEFIVRAVNSHDALVDTLRLVTELKDAADLPALIRHCKRVLENLEVPTIATKFLAPSNRKIGGQGND